MRCPKCDATVSENASRCNFCGQDLSMIHYIKRISNTYYNIGLEKASVRDLSGAIDFLEKSLQFNKANSDARNLLGLIYYEIGETVAALSQWVLSKYLTPENNKADYYIERVQNNQVALDASNQAIKKYNVALSAAQSGNIDLAIIQLRKVCSLNPRFLRAQHLLTLLYIKNEEYKLAAKCLNRARKIDFNNTTTLKYMMVVGDKAMVSANRQQRKREVDKEATAKKDNKDTLANVTPIGNYVEEKKSQLPVIYIIIGLIVGIAICFILIRPSLLKGSETGSQLSETNEQLSVNEKKLDSTTKEKDSLKKEVEDLKKQIVNGDTDAQRKSTSYEKLLSGLNYYMNNDKVAAAVEVGSCKVEDFSTDEAKALYEKIAKISDAQIKAMVQKGREQINSSFDTAIATFKKVLSVAPENQEAMVNMARCYQRTNKLAKAKKWYQKTIDIDATTEAGKAAKEYLAEIK